MEILCQSPVQTRYNKIAFLFCRLLFLRRYSVDFSQAGDASLSSGADRTIAYVFFSDKRGETKFILHNHPQEAAAGLLQAQTSS
jgi:hypothetical protein